MRIEVIHDKDDFFSFRIHDIHKIFYLLCPVCRCSMLPDTDVVFSTKRLYKRKDTTYAITGIFRIHFLVIAWTHWQRFPCFPKQLVWFFIHAYNRTLRVIRHFIDVQDIFHAGYKFCIFFWWDTPVIVVVRSKFVFFKTLRMVSLLTGVSISTQHLSSKSRSVHLECP